MATANAGIRKPTPEELRALVPLRLLSEHLLEPLGEHCDILRVPKGTRIQQRGRKQTVLLFVVSGEFRLEGLDGERQQVVGGTARAHFPLIPEGDQDFDAICTRRSDLLRLPLEPLRQARNLAKAARETEAGAQQGTLDAASSLEERIQADFREAITAGSLQLPGMPDVAARISGHIDSPKATSVSIARIIQTDPSIAARLIHVANSAAYATRNPVKTCKDAVTRLGRNATRELVTSFVLRGLFRTRLRDVKKRMQELWRHSTRVAALCHVLAKRSPGFEPARAMLLGLVHDIGAIPILANAHRYPGLAEDQQLLEGILDRLRGEVGAMTLRHWDFADEFVNGARDAEDWFRNHAAEPDYTDLLIVAQLHAYLGTSRMTRLPRIDEVPAFEKLAIGALSPRMSLVILDEAQQEIDEVELLLV